MRFLWVMVFTVLLSFTCQAASEALNENQGARIVRLQKDRVILLHGLGRSEKSMGFLARGLEQEGFEVCTVGYHSVTDKIFQIRRRVSDQISTCAEGRHGKIHFVGHSLGGILIRDYLKSHRLENMGRVVVLGSPNAGSDAIDVISRMKISHWIGEAGLSLGTRENIYPGSDEKPVYELGVIAGVFEPLSSLNEQFLPGDDDGLVTVASTRVDGMSDFVVVEASHAGLRHNSYVERQIASFLKRGHFLSTVNDRVKSEK